MPGTSSSMYTMRDTCSPQRLPVRQSSFPYHRGYRYHSYNHHLHIPFNAHHAAPKTSPSSSLPFRYRTPPLPPLNSTIYLSQPRGIMMIAVLPARNPAHSPIYPHISLPSASLPNIPALFSAFRFATECISPSAHMQRYCVDTEPRHAHSCTSGQPMG
jgi:hypothetical protein